MIAGSVRPEHTVEDDRKEVIFEKESDIEKQPADWREVMLEEETDW